MGDPKPLRLPILDEFFRQYPELDSKGIAIITGGYDRERSMRFNGNAGYIGEIPQGFNIGYLGHASSTTPKHEFVLYDPTKVEVRVRPFYASENSHALRSSAWDHAAEENAELKRLGFEVDYRSYYDRITVFAQKPIPTASLADGTSQPTQ